MVLWIEVAEAIVEVDGHASVQVVVAQLGKTRRQFFVAFQILFVGFQFFHDLDRLLKHAVLHITVISVCVGH